MRTKGRRRCACRRVLLAPVGHGLSEWLPLIEATSTVDRIRHTAEGCEFVRTMEPRVVPEKKP